MLARVEDSLKTLHYTHVILQNTGCWDGYKVEYQRSVLFGSLLLLVSLVVFLRLNILRHRTTNRHRNPAGKTIATDVRMTQQGPGQCGTVAGTT